MIYDVIIIGGGVVGCAIARELTRYHLHTLLIEKNCEAGFGTSKSNSGIIHAGHHASPKTLKGRLEWAGNPMWDALCRDLGFGFKRVGEITVAFTEEEIKTLEHLKWQGDQKGVPGMEIWDRERLRKEEPNLNPDLIAALYVPTSGVINPYEACFALLENAHLNGLRLVLNQGVTGVRAVPDGVLEVQTSDNVFYSRYVINAAGLHSDEIAEMAGVRNFTILPRKGEEYMLDKRLMGFVKRVVFPCPTPVSKGILIIPTFDGTIMVGPTALSTPDKTDLSTSTTGCEEIFKAVKRLAPGLSERDVIAEFAGLRAVSNTEDFVIGPTTLKGFINVAGIQSPGLTASPAIAKLVVDILRDEGLTLALRNDFVPTLRKPIHFAKLSIEEQIRLSEEDPRYGHIVCRCEHITEREVLDAIHYGARTLDGIKFRTRAGMGRCQGGFCTWRCMELLQREAGVPMAAVTKRGGDSWVVTTPQAEEDIAKVLEPEVLPC
jgi:glycerol-3-phosphate dehydrogenase